MIVVQRLARKIDALERRAAHLRRRNGGSYDRVELAAIEDALRALRLVEQSRGYDSNPLEGLADLLDAIEDTGRLDAPAVMRARERARRIVEELGAALEES